MHRKTNAESKGKKSIVIVKKNNFFSTKYDSLEKENMPSKKLKHNKIKYEINSNSKRQRFNKKAIELNNIAIKKIKFITSPLDSQDSLKLKEAVILFSRAISIDSIYYLAYANKAITECKLGKREEALKILNRISKFDSNYAEGFYIAGFIYEEMGSLDSANLKYKKSIRAYTRRIRKTNNINDMIGKAFILSLIDKEKGLDQINLLIRRYPQNKMIKMWKQKLFEHFDRKKFIKSQIP